MTSAVLVETFEHMLEEIYPPVEPTSARRSDADQGAIDAQTRVGKWCANRVAGMITGPCMALYILELSSYDERLHGADISQLMGCARTDGQDNRATRYDLMRALHSSVGEDGLPPCNDRRCLRAIQTNLNMRPIHRCSNKENGCSSLLVDVFKVASIYSKGDIPLLELKSLKNHSEINVVPFSSKEDFCAISHVW